MMGRTAGAILGFTVFLVFGTIMAFFAARRGFPGVAVALAVGVILTLPALRVRPVEETAYFAPVIIALVHWPLYVGLVDILWTVVFVAILFVKTVLPKVFLAVLWRSRPRNIERIERRESARSDILRLVNNRPGISQAELRQELGWTRPTMRHHVKVVVDAGEIDVQRDGRDRRLWPSGRGPVPAVGATTGRTDFLRPVLEQLRRGSVPARVFEDGWSEGLSRPGVNYRRRKVENSGRVDRFRQDGEIYWRLLRGLLSTAKSSHISPPR